jgi:hypothetical protein
MSSVVIFFSTKTNDVRVNWVIRVVDTIKIPLPNHVLDVESESDQEPVPKPFNRRVVYATHVLSRREFLIIDIRRVRLPVEGKACAPI